MTEHAPDVESNTTYKTRQEQENDERNDCSGSLAPTAFHDTSNSSDGGGNEVGADGMVHGASRHSEMSLGVPLPTTPAPSSKSPRTSHFGKNRGAGAGAAVSEEKGKSPRPSFVGPTKEVCHWTANICDVPMVLTREHVTTWWSGAEKYSHFV